MVVKLFKLLLNIMAHCSVRSTSSDTIMKQKCNKINNSAFESVKIQVEQI